MITGDVVEENRSQLPDDPHTDDLMHLVDEIERGWRYIRRRTT